MFTLTTRPSAATLRNQRGAVGERNLAANRERDYLARIKAEKSSERRLWIAWSWALATCKRRPDRAAAAYVVLVRLARELSGRTDSVLIEKAQSLAEETVR